MPPDAHIEFATEVGNCERFIRQHGANLRYCPMNGHWYFWEEPRFRIDDAGRVVELVKACHRKLWDFTGTPESERAERIKFARESEREPKIRNVISLAKSVPAVVVRQEQLDANPMLLGCPTVIVDLKTGELRPGRREDLITKSVAIDPQDAPCPLWLSVLERSFAGNQKIIAYIGRIFGLSLTGIATVQELFIFHGAGANGKSLILDTLLGIMGDYGAIASESLLTARSRDEHPTEIADTFGRRLIVASETEEGAKLRVQLVKKLTGDTLIKGRLMRQDYQQVKRTFKTILVTNNRPRVAEQSNAIWRRVKLIPFEVTIPTEEQDPDLLEKLKSEWPGILHWCIGGCRDWLANGTQTPREVLMATAAYQDESDPLAEYIADRIVMGPSCKASRSELYGDYQAYCVQSVEKSPLSRNVFIDHFRKLPGVSDKQWKPLGTTVPVRGFIGLGLRSGAENEEVADGSTATALSLTCARNTGSTGNDCYQLLPATKPAMEASPK